VHLRGSSQIAGPGFAINRPTWLLRDADSVLFDELNCAEHDPGVRIAVDPILAQVNRVYFYYPVFNKA
jgi:hypothetical protein